MSHYKTPIRIHINSTRKVNDKVGKYRLPFRKDEPVTEKKLSVSTNGKDQYYVTPESLRQKQTQRMVSVMQESPSIKQSKVEERNRPKSKQKQKSTKGQNDMASSIVHQYEQPKDQDNIITTQLQEPEAALEPQGIHSSRAKRFYENPMVKKLRYHSVASRYQEDESHESHMADRSLQTDFEPEVKKERWDRRSQELAPITQTKRQSSYQRLEDIILPSITTKKNQNRQIYKSLKKDDSKTWKALSHQIEQFRAESLKKELKRRKRLKSQHHKMSKSLTRSELENNQCMKIEQELKRFKQQKSMELNYKDDPYSDLTPIPEDSIETSHAKQRQNGFLQTLKDVIERQERSKAPKLKYPLEHYIENYYKIKQINPFFRKLNELAGCIILSIGKLKIVQSGYQIYDQGQPLSYIYLIIVGKVMMINSYRSFKKFALTGQTLGEEMLFQEGKSYKERYIKGSKPMFHRQQAKSLGKVCLLRIRPQKYYKVSNELNAIGYKGLFNLIDNLFKINYIKKQAIFHSKGRGGDRINTENLLNPRIKPSHFFH